MRGWLASRVMSKAHRAAFGPVRAQPKVMRGLKGAPVASTTSMLRPDGEMVFLPKMPTVSTFDMIGPESGDVVEGMVGDLHSPVVFRDSASDVAAQMFVPKPSAVPGMLDRLSRRPHIGIALFAGALTAMDAILSGAPDSAMMLASIIPIFLPVPTSGGGEQNGPVKSIFMGFDNPYGGQQSVLSILAPAADSLTDLVGRGGAAKLGQFALAFSRYSPAAVFKQVQIRLESTNEPFPDTSGDAHGSPVIQNHGVLKSKIEYFSEQGSMVVHVRGIDQGTLPRGFTSLVMGAVRDAYPRLVEKPKGVALPIHVESFFSQAIAGPAILSFIEPSVFNVMAEVVPKGRVFETAFFDSAPRVENGHSSFLLSFQTYVTAGDAFSPINVEVQIPAGDVWMLDQEFYPNGGGIPYMFDMATGVLAQLGDLPSWSSENMNSFQLYLTPNNASYERLNARGRTQVAVELPLAEVKREGYSLSTDSARISQLLQKAKVVRSGVQSE